MKLILPALLGAGLLTGCARQYTVTLNNGTRLSVVGKPQLEGNSFIAKDALGQPVRIPRGNVREIAPSSMADSRTSSGFKAEPMK